MPSKTTERWFCNIEFTFDVDTEPSKPRHEGDAQIDFAARAFNEGLREKLCDAFLEDFGINWTVLRQQDGTLAKKEGQCA